MNIESKEKLRQVVFLSVTIFLNVLNLLACSTFIIEDYLSGACTGDDAETGKDGQTSGNVDETASSCSNPGLDAINFLEVVFAVIFLAEFFYNLKQHSKPRY